LLKAEGGQILLMGELLNRQNLNIRRKIGYCPQQSALYPDLMPQENIQFFARLYGVSSRHLHARVKELMERFNLLPFSNTRTGALSGGWKQRLSLAVAIAHEPELLILDEPTVGVDLEAKTDLWRLIEHLRDLGTSILMTSHQLTEAQRLCHRVALMRNGQIAREGSIAKLLSLVPGQTVAKVTSVNKQAILQRANELGWSHRDWDDQLTFLLPHHLELKEIIDALGSVVISSISVQPVTLEDAYLEIMHTKTAPV
jgi:ABC-2 type transport system ATP-binding protein